MKRLLRVSFDILLDNFGQPYMNLHVQRLILKSI